MDYVKLLDYPCVVLSHWIINGLCYTKCWIIHIFVEAPDHPQIHSECLDRSGSVSVPGIGYINIHEMSFSSE